MSSWAVFRWRSHSWNHRASKLDTSAKYFLKIQCFFACLLLDLKRSCLPVTGPNTFCPFSWAHNVGGFSWYDMAVSLRPGQDVFYIILLIAIPWQRLNLIPRNLLNMRVENSILYWIDYSYQHSVIKTTWVLLQGHGQLSRGSGLLVPEWVGPLVHRGPPEQEEHHWHQQPYMHLHPEQMMTENILH